MAIGKPPKVVKRDLKTEVLKYENLNAPVLEYNFSRKNFYRNPKSTTGIYQAPAP